MSYGVLKIGSQLPLEVCPTLEKAQDILANLGSGYEIKRAAFFSLENQLGILKKEDPKFIADKIDYKCGEHILIAGEPQIGKLYEKQLAILKIIKEKELPVILLFRNFNTDYAQFQKRNDEFNNDQRKNGKKHLTLPEPHDILSHQDRLAELLKEPNVILGLANPKVIEIINNCLDTNPTLKNKICLIVDEADLATFELEDELTKTEDELNNLFPKLFLLISVTGTPGSILLCDKITQVYSLERPANYYGIDRIKHVPVEPIRSPEKSKQYDPELDSDNLKLIMDNILSLPSATLLIIPSRLTDEHKDVISYLSDKYGDNSQDVVYLELNDKSVKVYNKFGKQIEPDGIFTKCKDKKVGAIDKALQQYKHMSHIVIVSGTLAGRGISFVSSDYERHLTHQYVAASPQIHLETALQGIRLLGKYNDNPELTLYCSLELYEDLKNQPTDMATIIDLIKKSRKNKEALPKLIELQSQYRKKWLGKRKEKGLPYERKKGRKNSHEYELYAESHNIDEKDDRFWVESILLNTARSFARAILLGTWPGGADDKKDGKERVIYMNPLTDFSVEGIEKFIQRSGTKKATKIALREKGYKFLSDVKELYQRHPEYQGKILRRKSLKNNFDDIEVMPDMLIRKDFV